MGRALRADAPEFVPACCQQQQQQQEDITLKRCHRGRQSCDSAVGGRHRNTNRKGFLFSKARHKKVDEETQISWALAVGSQNVVDKQSISCKKLIPIEVAPKELKVRRSMPSLGMRKAWRRLIDEQCAMAREDLRRERIIKLSKREDVMAGALTVRDDEASSTTTSSSSDKEDDVVEHILAKRLGDVRRVTSKRRFRANERLVEAAVLSESAELLELVSRRRHGAWSGKALYLACEAWDGEMAATLLQRGWDDEFAVFGIASCAYQWKKSERRPRLERLLRAFEKHGHGLALQARSKQRGSMTALHAVVVSASLSAAAKTDVVEALIERGADPLCVDGSGQSALMVAVKSGAHELVRALVAAPGQRHVHAAAATSRRGGAGVLIDALVRACELSHTACVEALLNGRFTIDLDGRATQDGETALCAALAAAGFQSVRLLLSSERRRSYCSLRRENRAGFSPLYVAVAASKATGSDDGLRLLLEAADARGGADLLQAKCSSVPHQGVFAYALAISAWEAAACMVERGAVLDDASKQRLIEEDNRRHSEWSSRADASRRSFALAMLALFESGLDCDAIVSGDDWTINVHSCFVPMRRAPSGTSRVAALAALRYVYCGRELASEEADLDLATQVALLAAHWQLPGLRDACVTLASTKTSRFFSLQDAKRLASALGADPHDVVRRPLSPYATRGPKRRSQRPSGVVDGAALRSQVTAFHTANHLILKARSPFFEAMLRWTTHCKATVNAPQPLVQAILDHVYGLPLDPSKPTMFFLDLAKLADIYLLPDLKDEVDVILAQRKLDQNTIVRIFGIATSLSLKRTLKAAAIFLLRASSAQLEDIATEDSQGSKTQFVATVLRAAAAVTAERPDTTSGTGSVKTLGCVNELASSVLFQHLYRRTSSTCRLGTHVAHQSISRH